MKKTYRPKLTDAFLRAVRDEVFGPCTVIGECFTLKELQEDIEQCVSFKEWFEIRIAIEIADRWPETLYTDTGAKAADNLRKQNRVINGFKRRMELVQKCGTTLLSREVAA